MPWIEIRASGADDAPLAVTRLLDLATKRGFAVRVENQDTLAATGAGSIEIEPPDIDEQDYARAAVEALINEVPGGLSTFTIV